MIVPQRPLFALGLRLGSAASFATLAVLVKLAGTQGIALPEIMFWRQAVCLPIIVGWLALSGQLHQLSTRRIGAHATRGVIGTINMVCNFGAAILLPLAVFTTLSFTAPLFAVLLSALWFRERVGPWRWGAVALGFIGIVIVARPGAEAVSMLGVALAISYAVLLAITAYQIRDLGRTEAPIATVFWFSLCGTLLTAPVLPFVIQHHTPQQWALVLSLGVFGVIGQVLMTASLRLGAVVSVIVMDYTALIWASFYGWSVFGKLPSPALWIGAPLIVAAGLVIVWREHTLTRRARPGAVTASAGD